MADKDKARRLDPDRIFEMSGHEKIVMQTEIAQAWQNENNEQEQASALNNLGMFHFGEFRDEEAKSYLTQACAAAQEAGNKELLAKALVNLGLVYRYCSSQKDALECYLRAWEVAMRTPVPEVITSSTANIMILLDEEPSGIVESSTLATIESGAIDHGHLALAANLTRVHGEMLLRAGRRDEADEVLGSAIARSLAAADDQCAAEVQELQAGTARPLFWGRLLSKANGYLAGGRVPLAIAVYSRIITSFEGRRCDGSDYLVWLRIGVDCLESGLWQPACGYLSQLYEIAVRDNYVSMAAEALRYLADGQTRLRDLAAAQRSLIETIRIWTAAGSLIGEGVARFKLAHVLLEAGRPDEARRQAELGRDCMEEDGSEEAARVWDALITGRM